MTVHFGLAFDDQVYPLIVEDRGGVSYCGPSKFLGILEIQLGLGMPAEDNSHLRIEQYRQALLLQLQQDPVSFFKQSFEADQFGTAVELLKRRDELLLAGWNFEQVQGISPRLQSLAGIERFFLENSQDYAPGFADRFVSVQLLLPTDGLDLKVIYLHEKKELLPVCFQRLFEELEKSGIEIREKWVQEMRGNSDLDKLKSAITNGFSEKQNLERDGSLLILKSKRESQLSVYLAKLIKLNPSLRPLCLIPEKTWTLDGAMIQEGLPAFGIKAASLARPVLQVLKLVANFLWSPLDPYKVMEFVSLPEKPLESELARRIAFQLAQAPGIKSPAWNYMVAKYFGELEERAKTNPKLDPGKIRFEYNFWFNRTRFDRAQLVPREEAVDIFSYLSRWAFSAFEDSGKKNNSLFTLGEQARKIKELLEALPESQLSALQLEQIVRTVYEPAPVAHNLRGKGVLSFVHKPGAIAASTKQLLWWNFTQNEQDHFFSRWYSDELDFLEKQYVFPIGPDAENALLLFQRTRPVLFCDKQLILAIPSTLEGQEVHPHPLSGNIEALFENINAISFNIDTEQGRKGIDQFFTTESYREIDQQPLGKPKPFIKISKSLDTGGRETETFSSLESLFYYP